MTTSDLTARPKTSAGRGRRTRGGQGGGGCLGPGSRLWPPALGGSPIHTGCRPPGPISKGRGSRPAQGACSCPGGRNLGCIHSSGCQGACSGLLTQRLDPGRGLKFWGGQRTPLFWEETTQRSQEAWHFPFPASAQAAPSGKTYRGASIC